MVAKINSLSRVSSYLPGISLPYAKNRNFLVFRLLTIFAGLHLHFFNYAYLAEMNVQVSDAAMVTGAAAIGGLSPPIDIPAEDVIGSIEARTGLLPQITLEYEHEIGMLWITLKPEPKPVFTQTCGESVRKVQHAVMTLWPEAARSPVLFVAYRGTGPVFALGGDLDFYLECIAGNDRAALEDYARLAVEIMNLNASSLGQRVITMATIHARVLGGSIDPPRSCNLMIAEQRARFGYPEIAFNHFPIAAVPILSRRIGEVAAQRILMAGEEFTAEQFFDKGVVDEVVPDGTGEMALRDHAARFHASHAARVALYSAFYRHAGDLVRELEVSAKNWVDHVLKLRPLDIARLQRIVQIQDKMLTRLYNQSDIASRRVPQGAKQT